VMRLPGYDVSQMGQVREVHPRSDEGHSQAQERVP